MPENREESERERNPSPASLSLERKRERRDNKRERRDNDKTKTTTKTTTFRARRTFFPRASIQHSRAKSSLRACARGTFTTPCLRLSRPPESVPCGFAARSRQFTCKSPDAPAARPQPSSHRKPEPCALPSSTLRPSLVNPALLLRIQTPQPTHFLALAFGSGRALQVSLTRAER